MSEFIDFVLHNKKWWMIPIVVSLLILGLLVFLMSGAGVCAVHLHAVLDRTLTCSVPLLRKSSAGRSSLPRHCLFQAVAHGAKYAYCFPDCCPQSLRASSSPLRASGKSGQAPGPSDTRRWLRPAARDSVANRRA